MIRLLIVLLVLAGTMYLLLFRQSPDEPAQLKYQPELDKAKGLEQQMLQDAEEQRKKIDEMTK